MKIYISLPITGHDIAGCRERARFLARRIEEHGNTAITPFDICPTEGNPYAYYIGRDIEGLLGCDGILLAAGWSSSRGCTLEWRCAQIYNIPIFHHLNEIPAAKNNINTDNHEKDN